MADNVAITAGTGTTIATDEVVRNAVTEHEQVVKISLGAEGAHDMMVDSGQQTMANSVPVVIASNQSTIPVVGAAADGAAVSGNPVRVAGKDGSSNTQDIATDTAGNLVVVGPAADGAAVSGNPVRVAGKDGSGNTQDILTDTTGAPNVVGAGAHDAALTGNPVRIGVRGISADMTAVTTGRLTDPIASILGKQVVLPHALPGQSWSYAAASGGIVNTTGVTIKASGGAGVRNYITHLDVINGHATTSTDVQIRDGASGTVLHRGWAQAGGGGYSIDFHVPIRGSAATLLEVACGTTAAAVYVNANGFAAAE